MEVFARGNFLKSTEVYASMSIVFFLQIDFESNTASIKRTISNSQSNFGVFANFGENSSGSDWS